MNLIVKHIKLGFSDLSAPFLWGLIHIIIYILIKGVDVIKNNRKPNYTRTIGIVERSDGANPIIWAHKFMGIIICKLPA